MGQSVDLASDDVGITTRALQTLFRGIGNRASTYEYDVTVTLVELYNEQWTDLLEGATIGEPASDAIEPLVASATTSSNLTAGSEDVEDSAPSPSPVEEDDATNRSGMRSTKLVVRKGAHGMYIAGANRRTVTNVTDVLDLLHHGMKLRHVDSTNMNEASSRSHLVMMVDVSGVNQATQVSSYGRLSLVDLAGSERNSKSGAVGSRLVEASHINRSLSALADVFQALTDPKAKHVPFRNSKLTQALQCSLTGTSKTLMFVNISPSVAHAGETLCSLQFAQRAREVKLDRAQANVDGWSHKYKTMLEAQTSAFATKEKAYLAQLKQVKTSLKQKEKSLDTVQTQVRALQTQLVDAERRYELERARASALVKTSATTTTPNLGTVKDRKQELEEDKKWNLLHQELTNTQLKASEMKQQLDRVQNEWKDKYASLESKYKEQVERMRVQRIEWTTMKKIPPIVPSSSSSSSVAEDDGALHQAENLEVASLQRQVALLELEVKRLKITRNASMAKGTSASLPSSAGSSTSATVTATGIGRGTRKLSVSSKDGFEDALNTSTTDVPASGMTKSTTPTPANDISRPTASSSIRQTLTSSSASSAALTNATGSVLLAAKQAALQAQKRTPDAQATKSSGSGIPISRSNSGKAKGATSKLPATKLTTTGAAAAAAAPSRIGRLSGSGPAGVTASTSGSLLDTSVVSSLDDSNLTHAGVEEDESTHASANGDVGDGNESDADSETPSVTKVKRTNNIALPLRSRAHTKSSSNGSNYGTSVTASSKLTSSAPSASVGMKRTTPGPSKLVRPSVKSATSGLKPPSSASGIASASASASSSLGLTMSSSLLSNSNGPSDSIPSSNSSASTTVLPATGASTSTSSATANTPTTTPSTIGTRSMLRPPTAMAFTSAPKK